jgi:hypothetical protein
LLRKQRVFSIEPKHELFPAKPRHAALGRFGSRLQGPQGFAISLHFGAASIIQSRANGCAGRMRHLFS